MFKNRSFLVKMVDDRKVEPSTETEAPKNPPESIALELMKEGAKITVSVFAASVVLKTAGQIAIHIAETKIK